MVYIRKAILFYLLITTLLVSSGCHVRYASEPNMPTQYYSIELIPNDMPGLIQLITDTSKYVIIHCSDAVFNIDNIVVEADKRMIHGVLKVASAEHQSFRNGNSITQTYSIKEGQQPFNELHIHVNDLACNGSDMIAINKADIKYSSIYKDATRSARTGRRVNTAVKLTLLAAAAIAAIAIITIAPF